MSIITKRGDDGETDTLFGGRVSKNAPSIIAGGDVDELTSALGLVRTANIAEDLQEKIDTIQRDLIALMGLVSLPTGKHEKYLAAGYPVIGADNVQWLESHASEIEIKLKDWAIPGAAGNEAAVRLDHARTICRRAERSVWALGEDIPRDVCLYLNRLSDLLWLWARKIETAQ